MNKLVSLVIGLIGLSLVAIDADAKRLSGGRNLGTQRSAPAQQQAAPNAPTQQQQAAPAAPAPAQQPAGASKWLGPLAGLALGAGLAALFLNNGVTGLLAGLLVIGLVVMVLVFLARALRGGAMQRPVQYAGATGREPAFTTLAGGAGPQSVSATAGRWPAGFDADGFVRHARLNFVRLQEAYDKNDLSTMRDFLAPAVYQEVEADIRGASDAPKRTEVLTLDARVLDVAEEAGSYVVSVRFSGLTREADGQPEPFDETWHLEKPVKGNAGWLVAGIQQA